MGAVVGADVLPEALAEALAEEMSATVSPVRPNTAELIVVPAGGGRGCRPSMMLADVDADVDADVGVC